MQQDSMQHLAVLLKSRKTEDRIRAVKNLAHFTFAETRSLLLIALQDRSSYVASEAARILGEGADDSACNSMTERFVYLSEDGPKRDPGCHVRAELAFALGKREYYSASDALRRGIRTVQIEAVGGVPFDTGAHLRANCALALAQLRARDVLLDIVVLLFDTGFNRIGRNRNGPAVTSEPRKAAAQALARLGDLSGLPPLEIKLMFPGEETAEVLQECMQAVVELRDERAQELLEPYVLQHDDAYLAASAALTLAQTRTPEAVATLVESLARFRGDLLRAVILALSSIRTEEAEAALQALASHDRDEVRRLARELLPEKNNETR